MNPLTTSRLILRNFLPSDAPVLREMIIRYAASPYAAYDHAWPTDEDSIRAAAAWFAGGDAYLAVCRKDGGTFLGFVALNPTENPTERELGYVFDERYTGQGYATEAGRALIEYAFSMLGLTGITSHTAEANLPSRRLLARLGFIETGREQAALPGQAAFTGLSFSLTHAGYQRGQ